jgi:hypothetical protein
MRHRIVVAGTSGVVAMIATLGFGAGSAFAAPPADPAGGSSPVAPSFNNGNVEAVRGTGSDTTFFMMQKIGDLYTGAGLYGCTLNSAGGQTLFNSLDPASSTANQQSFCQKNANVDTTDATDNWNRTEVTQGVDDVGSGAGQSQLCGSINSPLPVDFARSSKPAGTACGTLAQTGYAKDGVPATAFPGINPSAFGTAPGGSPYASINGGDVGPVAKGWLPGDPVGGPYTGTPFTNVANNDNGGSAGSTAYRLWCASDSTRITDWGQLTNLSASGVGNGGVAKTVGNGAPVGIPLRIMGVNASSGTVSIFAGFAESGVSSGGCASNTNTNAANDPNPATAPSPNSAHVALENNASQISDFAANDFPGDTVSQAIEAATTLYYESNGVLNSVPFSGSAQIGGSTFSASKLSLNSKAASTAFILGNSYPTARTLFNIYRTDTVRASTAGFLNWVCDSQSGITKGKDNSTGLNFDTELGTLISSFGFIRLTDTSSVPAIATPADGISAPNTTCASGLSGSVGNGTPAITAVASPQT